MVFVLGVMLNYFTFVGANYSEIFETILLVQISLHIPKAFRQFRLKFSSLIMEVFLKREYKQHRVKCLLEEADSVIPEMKLLCGNLAEEILWDVSQHTCSTVRGDTTGLCRV